MLLYCIVKKSRLKCWLATRGRTRNRSSGTRATACWSSGVTGSARGDWRPWLPGCPPPVPRQLPPRHESCPAPLRRPALPPPEADPRQKGFLGAVWGAAPYEIGTIVWSLFQRLIYENRTRIVVLSGTARSSRSWDACVTEGAKDEVALLTSLAACTTHVGNGIGRASEGAPMTQRHVLCGVCGEKRPAAPKRLGAVLPKHVWPHDVAMSHGPCHMAHAAVWPCGPRPGKETPPARAICSLLLGAPSWGDEVHRHVVYRVLLCATLE